MKGRVWVRKTVAYSKAPVVTHKPAVHSAGTVNMFHLRRPRQTSPVAEVGDRLRMSDLFPCWLRYLGGKPADKVQPWLAGKTA